MLTYVEVENFRGFERFRLGDLSRVNLLVGENNCGKSSLLEAVHFLASEGDMAVLLRHAESRGETALSGDQDTGFTRSVVTHLFHGHSADVGAQFLIRGGKPHRGQPTRELSLSVHSVDDEAKASDLSLRYADRVVQVRGMAGVVGPENDRHPLREDDTVPNELVRDARRRSRNGAEQPRVLFASPTGFNGETMVAMWDRVLIGGREADCVTALRILEPRLKNVFFLPGGAFARHDGAVSGVYVELDGLQDRLPLGSFGDGMRHLLAFSLAMVQCSNGVLLFDEIDTGLHYSVMAKMWQLVVETACRSNVQVFATTHSSDCVRGLAQFCREHSDLQEEVSLQKISCELDESVALHAEEIILSDEQGMEVR